MKMRVLNLGLLIYTSMTSVALSPSFATEVQIAASDSDVVFNQGDLIPPDVTLFANNTTVNTTTEILIYQIGLYIVPANGATGTVGFASSDEADNYLFNGMSNPLTIPFLPQLPAPSSIDVSDSIVLSPNGIELLPGQPRGIVDLTFDVSGDAAGRFDLVLAPFTGDAIGGSSWASELVLNPMDANAFQNAQAGSNAESRVLTSIMVVPEPSSFVGLLLCIAGLPTVLRGKSTKKNNKSCV